VKFYFRKKESWERCQYEEDSERSKRGITGVYQTQVGEEEGRGNCGWGHVFWQ